uniref:non-specific serine/threonine protein kinase n=1 Tax=Oryza meridionalis TaxID=40149 RepID=A0A0E0EVY5_9ORYZ
MALLPCIAIAVLLSSSLAAAVTGPPGTIERVVKQQILASIPPGGHGAGDVHPPVLFLTSPSGKYAAYFVRSHTVPGAGGLGADFCYVEVVVNKGGEGDAAVVAGGGMSVWESECRPVSTVNTCTLLFSWHGLEVFDGSQEVWHGETNTDGTNFLQRLELVDDGDMRIRDKDGELAWRASDEPRHAQHCGAPGSPGLATAFPPFAEPIGAHSSDLPFGMFPGGNGRAAELPQAADAAAGALGGVGAVAPLPGAVGGAGAVAPLPGAAGGDAAAAPLPGDMGGDAALAPLPGALGGVDPAFSPLPGDLPDPAAAAAAGGAAAGVGGVGAGALGAGAVGAFGSQPLVDNSPYDSGAWKVDGHLVAIVVALGVVLGAI